MQVNILEAKNQLSKLVKAAQAGQEVVIAQRGVPAVRLVAISPAEPTPDPLAWLQAHPLPEQLRCSHEAIEASIQTERQGWD
ncbi:type II toxin-antitoxin system prevent-host-death family antitoxin [Cyanobium sp. HWJ4-Hawea]|uniref:type II toxin-antitoxin system Phd/YefM family antitoxin n=1 Tax=unclassified Cyanobium TaxID=2627006 RepID=UPI0020CCB90E|nr:MULTISPECIES: type II toxin-antitoxin system prevent-host-death family antitoxin [unclassified Cyanobium]MCP9775062.1 type II toxin-antitoxin system prevent-host-death family antitoxin [Cyanobium sp. WAJ14-Wanaka]MCP9808827.1 type II toxin-antitoxin system prevent-host-death family antitoxin [Cyanobium sp. HWJ4-Hawea]